MCACTFTRYNCNITMYSDDIIAILRYGQYVRVCRRGAGVVVCCVCVCFSVGGAVAGGGGAAAGAAGWVNWQAAG